LYKAICFWKRKVAVRINGDVSIPKIRKRGTRYDKRTMPETDSAHIDQTSLKGIHALQKRLFGLVSVAENLQRFIAMRKSCHTSMCGSREGFLGKVVDDDRVCLKLQTLE